MTIEEKEGLGIKIIGREGNQGRWLDQRKKVVGHQKNRPIYHYFLEPFPLSDTERDEGGEAECVR